MGHKETASWIHQKSKDTRHTFPSERPEVLENTDLNRYLVRRSCRNEKHAESSRVRPIQRPDWISSHTVIRKHHSLSRERGSQKSCIGYFEVANILETRSRQQKGGVFKSREEQGRETKITQ